MKAFGFDTFTVEDGDDLDEILSAINQARVSQKPAFIEVKTRIGKDVRLKREKPVHMESHWVKKMSGN